MGTRVAILAWQVTTLLAAHFGVHATSSDAPLMESGLDSVDAPAFVEHLNNAFGARLAPTLVLHAPTARSIAEHIMVRMHAPPNKPPNKPPNAPPNAPPKRCTATGAKRIPLTLLCPSPHSTLAGRWPDVEITS